MIGEKFPNWHENWEPINLVLINKMMDNSLVVFMDIAVILHLYMQMSLQTCIEPASLGDAPQYTPGWLTSHIILRNNERCCVDLGPTSSKSTAESGCPAGIQPGPFLPFVVFPITMTNAGRCAPLPTARNQTAYLGSTQLDVTERQPIFCPIQEVPHHVELSILE